MGFFHWLFHRKKTSGPTPMPVVLGVDATAGDRAANDKMNVTAASSAAACVNKMVKNNDVVGFYPNSRDDLDSVDFVVTEVSPRRSRGLSPYVGDYAY